MGCKDGAGKTKEQPSIYEQKMVELANREQDRYERDYVPIENQAIADASGFDSPARRAQYQGQAHVAAMSGMAQPAPVPGGGVSGMALRSFAAGDQMGQTAAEAATAADQTLARQKWGQMANLAAYGRGRARVADTNLRAVAGYAAGAEALRAAGERERSGMIGDTLGTVAGMGLYYGANKGGWFSGTPANDPSKIAAVNTTDWTDGYNPRLGLNRGQALA